MADVVAVEELFMIFSSPWVLMQHMSVSFFELEV